jgi:RNA polymerase sigma-70 factor (ECF subfamily)
MLEVIEGGRSSGRAWLKHIYSTYGGAVFARCQFLLKDAAAAEDATQDVFAKAVRHETTFRKEPSPLTWLISIATHHCLRQLRERQALWREQDETMERTKGESPRSQTAIEARELIRSQLKRFDLETQAAVIHYWVDDMTLDEVAHRLERSIPTVRKRLAAFAEATGRSFLQG